ncbi:TonB family protein [Gammaproteobacteria bacterium AB-CW1]|uniref:Protein TonB n=1 Tax=Natronospira elongata TaxID=3110268 RepID=A0AAP6JCK9_9GAMM|nr:TonB family protein [Gammaproteobacteria bacterium AB-CW1]
MSQQSVFRPAFAVGLIALMSACASSPETFIPEEKKALPKVEDPNSYFAEITRVAPEWPRSALTKGISGSVTMGLVIDADGQVTHIEVMESTPEGIFDRAAIRAVQQWRYQPDDATNAQSVRVAQTIDFVHFGDGKNRPDPLSEDDKALEQLEMSDPVFAAVDSAPVRMSKEARELLPTGSIKVLMRVEENGEVSRAKVAEAQPSGVFNAAVLDSVSQWQFHWEDDTEAKPVLVETEFEFTSESD